MDHGHLSMVADTCQGVCAEPLRNAGGTDVKCGRRQRLLPPLRWGLALPAPWASQRVEPMAALHGGFQARCGTTLTSKAFSNHGAKPHLAEFARTMTARLLREMTRTGRGFDKGRAVSALRPSGMQAGRALALHEGLRAVFPGRFKTGNPAAVALHTPMALLCAAPPTGVLPPDTTHAQTCLPEPAALRDRGLWAARGDGALHSWRHVPEAGGFLRSRAKAGLNPQGLEAFRAEGNRFRALRHKPLQTIDATRPTRQRVDLVGQWPVDGGPLGRRLIFRGHRRPKSVGSCLTNLPCHRDPLEGIGRADNWRGHVEVLLKAWQSSAHVPAFETANPTRVEGLLWTAMAAAALTRFLAPMTHRLAEVPMSTRKGAMGAIPVLGTLVEAFKRGDLAGLYAALETALTSLACQAQRAHPKRERQTGRAQLGLAPYFENDGMIEFAEAA